MMEGGATLRNDEDDKKFRPSVSKDHSMWSDYGRVVGNVRSLIDIGWKMAPFLGQKREEGFGRKHVRHSARSRLELI